MAKARDLAALAGLAGLAYAMRNKGKSNEDAGDQKTSSYAPSSNMTPIKGVGDATNDVATNKSAYATRSNMTPMQGVGDATNDPVVKVKPKATSVKNLSSSDPRNLEAGMSRGTVNREELTKKAAQGNFYDVTREPDNPESIKAKQLYDSISTKSGAGKSSAQKTDALRVSSRAAAAADARRRAAKQSSYKSGGMVSKVSSASSRADGIATKGKTRGKIC
jgi:hypothetical protein